MCLILFGHQVHPQYELVLAANRDEYLDRESTPMGWWNNEHEILAGVDLQAGGTWIGINRQGCWAAVTNFRGTQVNPENARSRGELVAEFLASELTATQYLQAIVARGDRYRGFNLIVGDAAGVYFFSNRGADRDFLSPLEPGVYGLSNHLLDTPWPKVELGKAKLAELIEKSHTLDHRSQFQLLADQTQPCQSMLPDTGISRDKEILLASMFIESPDYGTRCSTSLQIGTTGKIAVAEKSYPSGKILDFQFKRS